MIVIAGLLMIALLGAVLGSIGADRPIWVSVPDEGNGRPAHEIPSRVDHG
jgi:hypothetical protein